MNTPEELSEFRGAVLTRLDHLDARLESMEGRCLACRTEITQRVAHGSRECAQDFKSLEVRVRQLEQRVLGFAAAGAMLGSVATFVATKLLERL